MNVENYLTGGMTFLYIREFILEKGLMNAVNVENFNALLGLKRLRVETLSFCHPGWSVVAQFWLAATWASWVHEILLL